MHLLETRIFQNSLQEWLIAFVIGTAAFFVLTLLKTWVVHRLRKFAPQTAARWDDALLVILSKTRRFFFFAVSLFAACHELDLTARTTHFIGKLSFVALLLQIAIWGSALIRFYVDEDSKEKGVFDGARAQSMRAIGVLSNILLYVTILLWGLDNFGVNITTLVAGLGVGGIAVALAMQSILGDLFASLTIVLDKPFVYGDYITVGDYKGTIENVGMKTTRLKSQTGEQLIFPNSDLLQSRIRNFKRMQERRSLFVLGVSYDTPLEKLRSLPGTIRKIIESQPKTRFERAHLSALSQSAIDFEVVYWVLDPDYQLYMDTQQKIYFEVLQNLKAESIDFAFPTQTVHIRNSSKAEINQVQGT